MENKKSMKLHELYTLLLTMDCIDVEEWPQSLSLLSEDLIYKYINKFYHYFNGKSLDIDRDREELYDFARRESRYHVLCDNIKRILKDICDYDGNTVDLFILKNLIPIYDGIYESVNDYIDGFSCNKCELSKLSKDEVIEMVRDVLTEIDPSLEWLEIYNSILNDRIIYVNELSPEKEELLSELTGIDIHSGDTYVRTDNDGDLILLNYEGSINDVVNTIHEFIHYVNRRNCNNQINIFCEFPSIFYEYYTLNYLKRNGYSNDEVENVRRNRILDLYYNILDSFVIVHYIKIFVENYDINKELDIKYFPELAMGLKKEIPLEMVEDVVLDLCDESTEEMIINPDNLRKITYYIVGTYLTINAINNLTPTLLDEIRAYTNNMTDFNLYDLFAELGVNVDEINLKRSEKARKRVYN